MTAYIDLLEDGSLIIDAETGEILEQHGPDRMTLLAHRRHEAKAQLKQWESTVDAYDRALLANDAAGLYGPIVIDRRQSSYSQTDTEAFTLRPLTDASRLMGELPSVPAFAKFTVLDLVELVRAATKFDPSKLNPELRKLFDAATETKRTKPWIESRVALKPAPKLIPVPVNDDGEELTLAEKLELSVELAQEGKDGE